jgi:hypothetical protein
MLQQRERLVSFREAQTLLSRGRRALGPRSSSTVVSRQQCNLLATLGIERASLFRRLTKPRMKRRAKMPKKKPTTTKKKLKVSSQQAHQLGKKKQGAKSKLALRRETVAPAGGFNLSNTNRAGWSYSLVIWEEEQRQSQLTRIMLQPAENAPSGTPLDAGVINARGPSDDWRPMQRRESAAREHIDLKK